MNLGPLAPTWSEKIEALIEFFGKERFLRLVENHALPEVEIEEIIKLNVSLKKLKLSCIKYGDE